jgi:hypothetical protein
MENIDPAKNDPLTVHRERKKDKIGTIIMPGYRQHLAADGDTSHHVELTIGRCLSRAPGLSTGRTRKSGGATSPLADAPR